MRGIASRKGTRRSRARFFATQKGDGPRSERIVAVKVENLAARTIDYRLNILDVRVWEHSCQLIARSGREWGTIGPLWDLPVHVPSDAEELKAAAAEPLRLTACQYCAEYPGSDLAEVLSGRKDFAATLLTQIRADGSGPKEADRAP